MRHFQRITFSQQLVKIMLLRTSFNAPYFKFLKTYHNQQTFNIDIKWCFQSNMSFDQQSYFPPLFLLLKKIFPASKRRLRALSFLTF